MASASGRREAGWVANPLRSGAVTAREATGTVAGTRRGAMVVCVGVKNKTSPTVIGEKKGASSKAPEKTGCAAWVLRAKQIEKAAAPAEMKENGFINERAKEAIGLN